MADDVALELSRMKKLIFEKVRAAGSAGIQSDRLRDWLYNDHPDGGPESRAIVSVHVYYINKQLRKHGLKIEGKHTGARSFGNYRLVMLNVA